jgi:hypothetical protein
VKTRNVRKWRWVLILGSGLVLLSMCARVEYVRGVDVGNVGLNNPASGTYASATPAPPSPGRWGPSWRRDNGHLGGIPVRVVKALTDLTVTINH